MQLFWMMPERRYVVRLFYNGQVSDPTLRRPTHQYLGRIIAHSRICHQRDMLHVNRAANGRRESAMSDLTNASLARHQPVYRTSSPGALWPTARDANSSSVGFLAARFGFIV
jgi:hypothetical protein